MMSETTARLGLPLLAAGQAQKELFHNEALTRIDALLHGCVIAAGANDPPADPEPGQAWIVGSAPSGAWAGQAGAIAAWSDGGWRFVAAAEGMELWLSDERLPCRRVGGEWIAGVIHASEVRIEGDQVVGSRAPAIADPAGGTTADAQARSSISAVLAALRHHGLIDG
jgi:hypothetical protein